MSTLFNGPFAGAMPRPVDSFKYRDTTPPLLPHVRNAPAPEQRPEVAMTEQALNDLLASTRAEAAAGAEQRLRQEYEARSAREGATLAAAVEGFGRETRAYFTRVEGEIVRLALSIAAKILHRESQVDPMLVAALVQFALNQLRENTAVTVRVRPEAAPRWRRWFEAAQQHAVVTIAEDPQLEPDGCILETELGTANFSLAAQLKEIEQGFFDMLAQTPRG